MSQDFNYLAALQRAILVRHRCTSLHRGTVFVHEKTAAGETVWKGNVEVFDLLDCNESDICFAWQHVVSRKTAKVITVLGSRLIDTAHRAVQAAIFTDMQPLSFHDPVSIEDAA